MTQRILWRSIYCGMRDGSKVKEWQEIGWSGKILLHRPTCDEMRQIRMIGSRPQNNGKRSGVSKEKKKKNTKTGTLATEEDIKLYIFTLPTEW